MPGVKTNERPGTRAVLRHYRMSASKVRQVLDLIRGEDITTAHEILRSTTTRGCTRRRQGPALRCLQRRGDQPPGRCCDRPRRALRLRVLRGRGNDAEALAPPCTGTRHADPQAHVPHHGDREPARRREHRTAPRAKRTEATAALRCAQGRGLATPQARSEEAGEERPNRASRRRSGDSEDRRTETDRTTTDEEPRHRTTSTIRRCRCVGRHRAMSRTPTTRTPTMPTTGESDDDVEEDDDVEQKCERGRREETTTQTSEADEAVDDDGNGETD